MVVGIMSLRLMIPGAHSLKEKRSPIRSIKERLRSRFNVSVAEVDHQDYWQKAVLGVSAVGTDRAFVEGVLNKVAEFVRRNPHVELAGIKKDFVRDCADGSMY